MDTSDNSARTAAVAELAERAVSAVARAGTAISSRRGMTTVAIGTLIFLIAWLGERDSAWGFPMLVVGSALITLGLIGPRLSGSLSLRWGEDGAFFQLTSTIAPPGQRGGAPALEGQGTEPDQLAAPVVPPTEIEGSAETVEINIEAVTAAVAAGAPEAADESPSSTSSA